MYPRLNIDLDKFSHNTKALLELCKSHGISLAVVTKCFCADEELVKISQDLSVDYLADSRVSNIQKYPNGSQKTMMLRLPSIHNTLETVQTCDISFTSELETISALGKAAKEAGKNHGILLMIDLGDLREGIYYTNEQLIYKTVEAILSQQNLYLAGIGTNLTCYGSVLPTKDNLSSLCNIAKQIESRFDIKIDIISGGNSSSLYLLEKGEMPEGINNLRLGEAIIRGIETAFGEPFAQLKQDVITLEAEIVEMMEKPSMPEGELGMNAFGEKPTYIDRGMGKRAILAVGRQDIDQDGITCLTPNVEIIGASSDHLIVDVTNAKEELKVGDTLIFSLSYGAILKAFTSSYVGKNYCTERK